MAQVPSRKSFGPTAGAGPTPTFDPTSVAREFEGPRQDIRVGDAIRKSAAQLSGVALDAQRSADDLRVNDALNRARESAIDLRYNTTDGYSLLQGQSALERPEGLSLSDEYGSKFDKSISTISETLSNDRQKELFGKHSSGLASSFRGEAEKHTFSEFVNYNTSVARGAAAVSMQEVQRKWDDPEAVDRAINGVIDEETNQQVGGLRQAIEQEFKLSGASQVEINAKVREAESAAHTAVVSLALDGDNIAYAGAYFRKNKANMTGDDVLKLNGAITSAAEAANANMIASNTSRRYQTAFVPNDMARLSNVVVPEISPEVAKLTVEGSDVPWDEEQFKNDPEYAARVSNMYLREKVVKYPILNQALASYQIGDDAVDEAVAKSKEAGNPAEWLSYLPKATQAYVANTSQKFQSGAGGEPLPSEKEFADSATDQLPERSTPSAIKATRDAAVVRYKLLVQEREQKADNELGQAQQILIENRGNFADLPATVKMGLAKYDPEVYRKAESFAKAIRDGDERATDPSKYIEAVSNPGVLASMSDAAFAQFLNTGFSTSDQEEITKLRAGVVSGVNSQAPDTIDNKTINQTLNLRLSAMGINPKPKADDTEESARIANFTRFVNEDLRNQQEVMNRRLTSAETVERIDYLMTRSIPTPRGFFSDKSDERLIDIEIGDVPANVRDRIVQGFAARGIDTPNDTDILRAFWGLRVGRQK